jgi:anti-sigma regulatory factor (Ser/Thr protein kinase)
VKSRPRTIVDIRQEAPVKIDYSHPGSSGSGSSAPSLDVVVPAVPERLPELRDAARRFAHDNGLENPERVALAITEACTSAIIHAEDSEVPLALRLTGVHDDGGLVFVVSDRMQGTMPPPASPGLGRLAIIASMAQRVSVTGNGDGNQIRISFAD